MAQLVARAPRDLRTAAQPVIVELASTASVDDLPGTPGGPSRQLSIETDGASSASRSDAACPKIVSESYTKILNRDVHSVSDVLLVLEKLLTLDVCHGHRAVDPDAVAALLLSCTASMQTDKLRLTYETLLGCAPIAMSAALAVRAFMGSLLSERLKQRLDRPRVAAKPA